MNNIHVIVIGVVYCCYFVFLNICIRLLNFTYHAATGEHDSEPIDDARRADHPRQPDKQNDSEDVLHARQVDANQCAHPGRFLFGGGRLCVGLCQIRDGVRVVGDRVEESGHPRPVIHFILQSVRHTMISYTMYIFVMSWPRWRNWSDETNCIRGRYF